MAEINFGVQTAQEIDREKLKLEGSSVSGLRSIFRDLAADAAALYKVRGVIPAADLALNYTPDFTKEVRDAFRKSIKKFGNQFRKGITLKSNQSPLKTKQTLEITDPNLAEKLKMIDDEFKVAATLFVANESETQIEFVTETTTKQLETVVATVTAALVLREQQIQEDILEIEQALSNLEFETPTTDAAKKRIREERRKLKSALAKLNREQDKINDNRTDIIADNIEKDINDRAEARSELVAAQSIGLAEAFARDEETSLIEQASIIGAALPLIRRKEWIAILDSRVRPAHAAADGQTVRSNETFTVGGESLRRPRDPRGSAGNIINCRCIAQYSFFEPLTDENVITSAL